MHAIHRRDLDPDTDLDPKWEKMLYPKHCLEMKQLTDPHHIEKVVCCSRFTTSWTPNFGLRLYVWCSCRSVFIFCRVDRVDSAEGGREAGADSARQVCQPGDAGPAHRQRQGPRCLCHSGQATPSSLTCIPFVSPLLFDFSLLFLHLLVTGISLFTPALSPPAPLQDRFRTTVLFPLSYP